MTAGNGSRIEPLKENPKTASMTWSVSLSAVEKSSVNGMERLRSCVVSLFCDCVRKRVVAMRSEEMDFLLDIIRSCFAWGSRWLACSRNARGVSQLPGHHHLFILTHH